MLILLLSVSKRAPAEERTMLFLTSPVKLALDFSGTVWAEARSSEFPSLPDNYLSIRMSLPHQVCELFSYKGQAFALDTRGRILKLDTSRAKLLKTTALQSFINAALASAGVGDVVLGFGGHLGPELKDVVIWSIAGTLAAVGSKQMRQPPTRVLHSPFVNGANFFTIKIAEHVRAFGWDESKEDWWISFEDSPTKFLSQLDSPHPSISCQEMLTGLLRKPRKAGSFHLPK